MKGPLRPCAAIHPEPIDDPAACKTCWLYLHDDGYRALYDGAPMPPKPPKPARGKAPRAKAGSRARSAPTAPRPQGGPGTELKAILASLGLTPEGCGCEDRARRMDGWGVAGCLSREAEILAWLRAEQANRGWLDKLRAAALAVATGLAFQLDPLDPAPGLFREAIRRAEAKRVESRPPFRWVSTADLVRATVQALLPQLPPDLAGVYGVARSGMLPASILATHLHLPLGSVSQHDGTLTRLSEGSRKASPRGGPVLVVDDTVYSGAAMRSLRARLAKQNALYAAVYARPESADVCDLVGENLPSPHLLEWNLFNGAPLTGRTANPWLHGGVATDLDGVLCLDPTIHEARDPAGYAAWIPQARPLHLPRRHPVPWVVTFRRECHREATEAWFARWGVRANHLVMHPSAAPLEVFDAGAYKGRAFRDSPCALFVESDPRQARAIAEAAGKPVACPATGEVFSPPL